MILQQDVDAYDFHAAVLTRLLTCDTDDEVFRALECSVSPFVLPQICLNFSIG
jgi:hypothetical protein